MRLRVTPSRLVSTLWLALGLGLPGCNHGISSARDSGADVAISRSPQDSTLDLASDRSPQGSTLDLASDRSLPDSAADIPKAPDSALDLASDRRPPDTAVDRAIDRLPPDSAADSSNDRASPDSGMDGYGDLPPPTSGVGSSKYLDELGADEIRQLCSWTTRIIEPGEHKCPSGTTISTNTASECVESSQPSISVHCQVSLVEDCFNSTGGDACKILITDACRAYIDCATGK